MEIISDRSRGQTASSTRSPPSAATKKLILELGLKYQPNSADQQAGHDAKVAMLTEDVAEIPPALLREVIDHVVRTSPFMPRAADIHHFAKNIGARRSAQGVQSQDEVVAAGNANLAEKGRMGLLWVLNSSGQAELISRAEHERRSRPQHPPTDDEMWQIMKEEGALASEIMQPYVRAIRERRRAQRIARLGEGI